MLHLRQASAGSDELPGGTAAQSGDDQGTTNSGAPAGSVIGATAGMLPVPSVPFCRAGADVGTMWLPVWDSDSKRMEKAKRIVVFGGKG